MHIKIRPGGINPSPYELEEVYKSIREADEIKTSSPMLLDRIRLGVSEGELPYGTMKVSVYDDRGVKVTAKMDKYGRLITDSGVWDDIWNIFPLDAVEKIYCGLIERHEDAAKKICGNCTYNKDGMCMAVMSPNLDTYVTDFETCEEFKWVD